MSLRDVATKVVEDWKAERELPYLSPTACRLLVDRIEAALVVASAKVISTKEEIVK